MSGARELSSNQTYPCEATIFLYKGEFNDHCAIQVEVTRIIDGEVVYEKIYLSPYPKKHFEENDAAVVAEEVKEAVTTVKERVGADLVTDSSDYSHKILEFVDRILWPMLMDGMGFEKKSVEKALASYKKIKVPLTEEQYQTIVERIAILDKKVKAGEFGYSIFTTKNRASCAGVVQSMLQAVVENSHEKELIKKPVWEIAPWPTSVFKRAEKLAMKRLNPSASVRPVHDGKRRSLVDLFMNHAANAVKKIATSHNEAMQDKRERLGIRFNHVSRSKRMYESSAQTFFSRVSQGVRQAANKLVAAQHEAMQDKRERIGLPPRNSSR